MAKETKGKRGKYQIPNWLKESAESYVMAVPRPFEEGIFSYLKSVNREYMTTLTPRKRATILRYLESIGVRITSKITGEVKRENNSDNFRAPKDFYLDCKRVVTDSLGFSKVCGGKMLVETAPPSSLDKYQARCPICKGWVTLPIHPAHPDVREI